MVFEALAKKIANNGGMYFVYILKSVYYPDRLYTGYTANLKKRIAAHNSGKSPHTKKYKPWKLVFCCVFSDKYTAIAFEEYLKTASGIAFRNKRLLS